MKIRKLKVAFEYDFDLLGISSKERPHRLAFELNRFHFFDFWKVEDLMVRSVQGVKMIASNYVSKADGYEYIIIGNHLEEVMFPRYRLLLPQLKEFDYFLKLMYPLDEMNITEIERCTRRVQCVESSVRLDKDKIRHIDYLIF